ncbi:MAG: ribosome-associated translation inhibitor RaiA [Oscillospiraceae bacterium]|nr:ribosome-associated translation inhibitor RaiA [Oscillospiraceae bacterium]
MKFKFTNKKVTLPKSVHAYAEKKVSKLERYFQTEPEASVVFSVEKGRNNAEVTVRVGGTILRSAQSTPDMFVSIDAAVADIERQLRKNKARLEKRLRKDAFVRTAEADETSFVPDEDEEEYNIVRTKRFPIKPMSVEEAVLQMNLLDHTFFAFKNEDAEGAFAVVYRRQNGGYGLIEDD